MAEPHRISVRVYYEDTDLAGIVYYANYFRYIERGRTEYLRARGIDQMALKESDGLVFAVRKVNATYHRPARMDDLLDVVTVPVVVSGARIVMDQEVRRDDVLLFAATVELAALGATGQPVRLPPALRALAPAPRASRP